MCGFFPLFFSGAQNIAADGSTHSDREEEWNKNIAEQKSCPFHMSDFDFETFIISLCWLIEKMSKREVKKIYNKLKY